MIKEEEGAPREAAQLFSTEAESRDRLRRASSLLLKTHIPKRAVLHSLV